MRSKSARFLFLVNHANGSQTLYDALGRERVVVGFPGAAGGLYDGVDRYVDIREQRTAIEVDAPDIAALLVAAGFRVERVRDMDSWLRRHAVFVTAIAGALYAADGNAARLASDTALMRTFVRAVREGWAALDRRNVAAPSFALRAIFRWVPLRSRLRTGVDSYAHLAASCILRSTRATHRKSRRHSRTTSARSSEALRQPTCDRYSGTSTKPPHDGSETLRVLAGPR